MICGHKNMDVKLKPVIIIAIVFVLFIPSSVFALEVNPENIDLSTSNTVELEISGEIEQYLGTTRLVLTIIYPDNSEISYDIRVVGSGPFSKTFAVDESWDFGEYIIYGKYGEISLESTSFTIEKPYDPRTDVKAEVIEPSLQIES